MILPQNNMTEWYWSGSLHTGKVCSQRLDHHSQQETQAIAALIHQHCQQLYPVSWAALTKEQYEIDDQDDLNDLQVKIAEWTELLHYAKSTGETHVSIRSAIDDGTKPTAWSLKK